MYWDLPEMATAPHTVLIVGVLVGAGVTGGAGDAGVAGVTWAKFTGVTERSKGSKTFMVSVN
jgi:hypothetical protein